MAVSNNANIGFEKQIWDAACVLWGHIPAAEYRKVIVGLIFLRYISSSFEKKYEELVAEGDGFEDDRDAYAEDNIFFVPEEARWGKIALSAHTPEIGTVIDDAMRAIEAENKSLKNVLPKNYASPDLDKRVLGDVVDLFTNMDMGDTEESKDLLGRTYEYCIAQFAAYEGVKGGEFYTPSSIVKTIVAILKPFSNCRVYDPCCGSGGMFVQSVKFLKEHAGNRFGVSVYGQESNADTWKMAKMNILEVVEQFYFENYRSPSLAEIAAEIGVVRNTVHRYLYEMDRDGTLKYDGSCIKTPKTDKADFSSQCAPVVGRISCGPLEEAEEDLEEFVALPTALFGSGDFMILRASGESMIERGIDSGDLVVIEKNVTPRDGDIVAIREGSGNTLKQFFYEPDKKRIKLHPWNSTMNDIYLHDLDNVQIYGVARKVIKEL